MCDYKISLVICKCEVKYDKENILHEDLDKDKFQPDGIDIMYVKGNYAEYYHPNYVRKDQEQKDKLSNKGRKPKPPKAKRKKVNGGTGKQFASALAFGVLHEGNIYNIIVFRKDSINISGLTDDNIEGTKAIITKLFDFMNNIDPELNIRMASDPQINLCNAVGRIPLNYIGIEQRDIAPDVKPKINIYRLSNIMLKSYNYADYWQADEILIEYNNTVSYLLFHLAKGELKYSVKLYAGGKINIYGGKDKAINLFILERFNSIITEHRDYLIQLSYPARSKSNIA